MVEDKKRKRLYISVKVFQIGFAIIFSLFSLFNTLNSDIWTNNGALNMGGRFFLCSWIGMTVCMVWLVFLDKKKDKRIEEQGKEIQRDKNKLKEQRKQLNVVSQILSRVNNIHTTNVTSLIVKLDNNFDKKTYKKVTPNIMAKSKKRLKEMGEELDELVLLYFGKTSEIKIISSLSYKVYSSDWNFINIENTHQFDPELAYEDKNSYFHKANKAKEDRLFFYPENEREGTTLCYGFKVASDKFNDDKGKRIIFIEAILLVETREKMLSNKKNAIDSLDIKDFLELRVFDNYINKMKKELVNFFIHHELTINI